MTLILNGTDNSATTPAVTGTDTDTGVYYPTSNQVAIATNGTQAMLVNASQNVGIGTASPNFKVSFGANIGNTFALFENAGASVYGIGMGGAGSGGDPYRLKLFSNGTENACITDTGNVGIGTTAPGYKLALESGSNFAIHLLKTSSNDGWVRNIGNLDLAAASGGGGGQVITFSTGANYAGLTERMRIDGTGNLLSANGTIQFTSAQYRSNVASSQLQFINNSAGVSLAVNGTSWGSLSDERDKEIIEPITDAVSKVSSLRSVIGRYKVDDADKRRAFLIAQDVKAVLPEAVTELDDEQKTLILQYTETIPLLVAAIKEQQVLITTLTDRITALEAK